jgi:hypothetical protein
MKTMRLTVYSLAIALGIGTLSSCGDDDENNNFTLPPIGGYNTSDEIASSNLVAKWSFEGNATESKTNTAGTQTNAAYTAGAKGQAWDGSASQARYSIYDGLTGIGNVNNFTVSFWMNSAGTTANPDPTPAPGLGAQGIFSLVKPTEFWGAMNVFLENPDTGHPDRMILKILVENKRTGVVWGSYSPTINIDGHMNEWVHVVITYNASTSKFSGYVNGLIAASMGGPYAPEDGFPGSLIAYADNPGDVSNTNGAALWGDIDFGGSFSQVVIGSHQFTTTPSLTNHGAEPWSTSYAGKLDEFRVYNSALSGSDVGALYELEKAGR